MTLKSNRQVKSDLANSAATRPTQNGNNRDDADTEGTLEPSLTTERRNGDGEDKVTLDSSKSTYDTPGNEEPKGTSEKGDSDRHDAPHRPSSETCGRFCNKKSKLDPHKQYAVNCNNKDGESTEKEAEEGSDNVVVQPARKDGFIRSNMRHDSRMRTVTVANMNSDLKVGAETNTSKDTDEKDNRPDSSE